MNNIYKLKNWQAYISYHGNNVINNFNLKESSNIKLWNINKNIGINKLHYHYSNLVCAYYIWKNNIKFDYICIWDHRRYLIPINFNKLDNNMIQVYYHTYTELTPFEYMIKDGINEYIIYQFIKYMIEIKHINHELLIDKIYVKPWKNKLWFHSCFNCNWNVFNDICNFIFGFISYVIPNGKYDDQLSCNEFIKDLQRSFCIIENKYKDGEMFTNNGRIKSGDRDFGNLYELLLPLYCDLIWNGSFHEKNYNKKLGIELLDFNKDKVYNIIFKWISKNTFTGTLDFYIKTSKNNIEFLQNLINETWYRLSSGNVYIVDEFPKDVIILNYDEYIDVDDPLDELNLNNIKKFDNEI